MMAMMISLWFFLCSILLYLAFVCVCMLNYYRTVYIHIISMGDQLVARHIYAPAPNRRGR